MPGRAAFYPGSEIILKNQFQLFLSDTNAVEYRSIISGEQVKYSVKGIISLETAWSIIEKEFESSMWVIDPWKMIDLLQNGPREIRTLDHRRVEAVS